MRFSSPPSSPASSAQLVSRKYSPLPPFFRTYRYTRLGTIKKEKNTQKLTSLPHAPLPELGWVCVGSLFSPSLSSDKITDSKDIKKWIDNYLGMGEWVMDQSIAVLSSTSYFERKR
ncbi:hypothetical protein BJX61DRAFT_538608 [Aspergillus egyptiacus]|nr:hypothetical protein BJX61DRAFT_538608 [Aspergillus egyptiacus]